MTNQFEFNCKHAMAVLRNIHLRKQVDERDVSFLKSHTAHCAQCQADSAVIRGVLESFDDPSAEKTAEVVLRRLKEPQEEKTPLWERWAQGLTTPAIAAAAALAVAIVTVGLYFSFSTPKTVPMPRTAADMQRRTLVAQSMKNDVPKTNSLSHSDLSSPAYPNSETIRAFTTEKRVLLPTGIKLLLKPDTTVSIRSSDANGMSVLLERGGIVASVDPTRVGPPFRVATAEGEVRVTGTIFSVTVKSRGAHWVAVLRGHVAVTDLRNRVQTVQTGERLSIGKDEHNRIGSEERLALSESVVVLEKKNDVETETVDLQGVSLDGTNPIAGPQKPDNIVAVSSQKEIGIENPPLPSLRALLVDVRKYRSLRQWDKVTTVYQDILRYHQGSATAQEALVALGDIQLTKLHHPDIALDRFNQYIKNNNEAPLIEEALIGKAKALKELHRLNEERVVLEAFRNRYPKSAYTPSVEKRLSEIER